MRWLLLITFLVLLQTSLLAAPDGETPADQIASNIQKNRDGTVRFSKPVVMDEHLKNTNTGCPVGIVPHEHVLKEWF